MPVGMPRSFYNRFQKPYRLAFPEMIR